jgi:outer membrane protein OmpA-like peptidoglycan-associated protein
MREHPTACKVGSFLTGAALGATGAGVGFYNIENDPSQGETAAAASAGFVAGGLIGMLIGHHVCASEAPPPPPPPPPAPPAKGTKIQELQGPHFDFDKATLTAEGRRRVADAARTLKDHSSVRVSVDGYTDSIGSDAYNQALSERRARTVATHLEEEGISRSRMTVKGYGESRPIADNSTEAGRAKNRRVEIIVD